MGPDSQPARKISACITVSTHKPFQQVKQWNAVLLSMMDMPRGHNEQMYTNTYISLYTYMYVFIRMYVYTYTRQKLCIGSCRMSIIRSILSRWALLCWLVWCAFPKTERIAPPSKCWVQGVTWRVPNIRDLLFGAPTKRNVLYWGLC